MAWGMACAGAPYIGARVLWLLLLPASLLTIGAISYSLWQALTFDPVAVSVSSPRHDAALSANTASATGSTDAESLNWQRVAQQHWFGRPAPVTAVTPPPSAVLKETPLKLVLRGISAGRFPSAVIDAAGNTQTYEKAMSCADTTPPWWIFSRILWCCRLMVAWSV
ncbi:hypothetical protein PCI56_11795 [Plesiomonas shigelloides subsp. oncorhynchi]|nr:hypothetical protein [Plesiomonas shigelloides]